MTLAGLRETAIAWTRISYEKPIRTRGTRTRLDARRLRHCRFGGGCRCLLRLTQTFYPMKLYRNDNSGKFLTQRAYDTWMHGQASESASVQIWTSDLSKAALMHADETPPLIDGCSIIEDSI